MNEVNRICRVTRRAQRYRDPRCLNGSERRRGLRIHANGNTANRQRSCPIHASPNSNGCNPRTVIGFRWPRVKSLREQCGSSSGTWIHHILRTTGSHPYCSVETDHVCWLVLHQSPSPCQPDSPPNEQRSVMLHPYPRVYGSTFPEGKIPTLLSQPLPIC